ncbi:hypothetical protein [Bacillus haynesii]|uniref:hypothetical protein n=1 Tax=Bacillus haynesii TaxID=1925021 RepID=UPI0022830B3B|nr:hypothetical protein [Bacillus haynesii]MCY7998586.1 hypothetical protein [Bacillus haynesii]
MAKVDYKEYPSIRSWETKVSAMPNIPRGEKGFQKTLKYILTELKNKTPINTSINIEGSRSKKTLEQLYIRLRPSGFVKKMVTGWELSEEADKWLESGDNLYLAAMINANVRFFSEILAVLIKNPATSREVQDVASNEYKLSWKTKSEIHARLNWLKDLGLIEFEDFSLKYSISGSGEEFLKMVSYVQPEELKSYIDQTLDEKEVPMSTWALEMCKMNMNELRNRKIGMGYYPGGIQDIHNTILDYLLMMNNPTELSTIVEYSSATFGISEQSTRSFISSLINLEFIKRKTKTLYETTELGYKFPTKNFEIDFASCINNKFSFVFEILLELQKKELNVKELAAVAKASYNFPSENPTEIHKRLNILKNAKLIQETGFNLFGLTNRGENLCKVLEKYSHNDDKEEKIKSKIIEVRDNNSSKINELLYEIRISSRESSNPNWFEESLANAFKVLGFKSEWLGGAGKTDILIQAPTSPKFAYTVAIDAKTTYSGGVTEGQINFDTIVEHRKKHKADFSLVVGREFQGDRLIERAIKHNVALLDIEKLEHLIKMHTKAPLKSDSYRKVFSQKGIIDVHIIEEDRNKIVRDGNLLKAIMKCLFEESNDPLTEGIMQPREIYLLLKNQININPTPTISEIKQILEFLSSPLIGCIGTTKEGYYALGSLTDAVQKFDFYLKACTEY